MTLIALVKKELREQLRTHKLTVLFALFFALGLLSPIAAKMMPELLKSAAAEVSMQLPPPTALSAVDQYLKNLSQMGMIVLILLAMGAVAGERERGTAAMILCKPVSRGAFVASKFIAYTMFLAAALALAALSCYYYTMVLFQPLDALAFAGTNALIGLYLLVLLAVTLLSSAALRSPLAAGGLAFALSIAISLVGAVPNLEQYSPGTLPSWGRALLAGVDMSAWPALYVSAALVLACVISSWFVFRRQEL